MNVQVDEPRGDYLPGGIDHQRGIGRADVPAHRGDLSILEV
jgi:hypothetical protein